MLRGLMRLEERIVLDASAAADADDGEAEDSRILVVDQRVEGSELLAAAARDGVTVVVYDSGADTLDSLLDKIREAGGGLENIVSIAFAGHGEEASMQLTVDGLVSLAELGSNAELAAFWTALAGLIDDDGRIDILACDFYRGEEGRELLAALEALTGMDFAASDDRTGNAEHGGDWFLESDDIALDETYFDTDFLADFAFLAYIGNDLYLLPDTDELALAEGMTILDWSAVFPGTVMVADERILNVVLTWNGSGNIADILDLGGIDQLSGKYYAMQMLDSVSVMLMYSYFSAADVQQLGQYLDTVTMKAAENWEGGSLTITIGQGSSPQSMTDVVTKTYVLAVAGSNTGDPPVEPPVEPPTDPITDPVGENVVIDIGDDGVGIARYDGFDAEFQDFLLLFEEFPFELFEFSDDAFADVSAEISVEMHDVQSALRELHGSVMLLLNEFAQSDAETGAALRPAVGELVASAQAQISEAARLVSLAADAAREWNALPPERRDGVIGDSLAAFAQNLLETNARVNAAVEGVDAARESIAASGDDGAPDADGLLARVAGFVDAAYARIRDELARRDSLFYELESLRIRGGRFASADDGVGE